MEDGIQVLAGLAQSKKSSGIYIENPVAGIADWKNSTNSEFGEFTSMENVLNCF
jgi:hypothetical protein